MFGTYESFIDNILFPIRNNLSENQDIALYFKDLIKNYNSFLKRRASFTSPVSLLQDLGKLQKA